jgi:hypothetical protein
MDRRKDVLDQRIYEDEGRETPDVGSAASTTAPFPLRIDKALALFIIDPQERLRLRIHVRVRFLCDHSVIVY